MKHSAQLIFAAVFAALAALGAPAAQAGDVTFVDKKASKTRHDGRCNVKITGAIDNQTVLYFRNVVGAMADAEGSKILGGGEWGWNVCLSSTEGAFEAGVKLGTVIKDFYMGTVILPGEKCLGACAVAFLGGAIKIGGDIAPLRMMHKTSLLGFNGPPINKAAAAKDPALAHYVAISQLVDMMSFMSEHRADKDKLLSIRPIASLELIRQMLSYSATEYYTIIHLRDLSVVPVKILDAPKYELTEPQKRALCAHAFAIKQPAYLTSQPILDRELDFSTPAAVAKLTVEGGEFDVFVSGKLNAHTCQISSKPDAQGRYRVGVAPGEHLAKKITTVALDSYFAFPESTKLADLK